MRKLLWPDLALITAALIFSLIAGFQAALIIVRAGA